MKKRVLTFLVTFLIFAITTNAQWSELGDGSFMFNNTITCMTKDLKGNIYVSGNFTNSRGAYFVAKWDGTSWSELGGTNKATFIKQITCIGTDNNSNVYVTGNFTNVGNYYIAKWDGTKWSELGGVGKSSFSNYINSMIVNSTGTTIYATGAFKNAKGNCYVAVWNGSSWAELGGTDISTFNAPIQNLSVGNGAIYGVGQFYNMYKSNGNYYVAEYRSGLGWDGLGGLIPNAFNSQIYCITGDKSLNALVAGAFTNSKGKRFVAKWDGINWIELGGSNTSTFNNYISNLVTDNNNNTYAAGGFTNDSGKYYIAVWNGKSWAELGGKNKSTFNSGISSILTDKNGNLYAAGDLINTNGYRYVAKFSNAASVPITLARFAAVAKNKAIQTNWHTSTELNTANFIIQHSTDGSSFTDIGTVKAIGSGANGYSFTDNNPTVGTNYYRLKSVDKDGASSYSKTVSAEIVDSRYEILVVPNPVRSIATIKGKHIASIQVVDNLGRVVKTVSLKDAINPTLSVGGLPAGVYHLRVQTTDGKVSNIGIIVN